MDTTMYALKTARPLVMNYASTILTIATACVIRQIPFSINPIYDGMQMRFPWCNGDIVCHSGSYGCNCGHVESMGFPWDDGDVTEMTFDEAIHAIEKHFKKTIDNM